MLAMIAAVIFALAHLSLGNAASTAIVVTSIIAAAWFGGVGPAVLIAPWLFVIVRYQMGQSLTPNLSELFTLGVVSCVTGLIGLAGQYRRRIRAIEELHSQKLRDQSRAVSLAHIVFRGVDGRVTEWNEGVEKMFGWSADEAIGRNLHELLRTEFPVSEEQLQESLLRTGQWQGEVVCHRNDGSQLIIATHWILYRDDDGRPVGVAEVHNDVTALRRAEEAVRDADRRKDEFLAILAHELRNPLAPIRSGLELMKSANGDLAVIEEVRGVLERQTQQLVSLVDDLLDVSRITSGKLTLRRQRLTLNDVVQRAVEASQPYITAAGHRLSVELPKTPVYLNADLHRMSQVLSNLLNNAAKFTPTGGFIRLRAETHDGKVTISVQDNGVGIPASMQASIFEPFSQIKSHEHSNSGLGLGLNLVKSLVAMHEGTIHVESDGPDRGSTFHVTLPILTGVEAESAPATDASPAAPSKRRVLVVDDNTEAADLLSRLVKLQGHTVQVAHDGKSGIDVAAEFQPEIVLMDLSMPGMNGFDAARQMREQSWGQALKIVALTGWGQDEDRRRTSEAGFDYHLVKPVELAQLRQVFAELESGANVAAAPTPITSGANSPSPIAGTRA